MSMTNLYTLGAVTAVWTLFIALVRHFADPPEDPQPEPEIHHVASGAPPWEPAPFPEPDPQLDYQIRFPLDWIEKDEVAERIDGTVP